MCSRRSKGVFDAATLLLTLLRFPSKRTTGPSEGEKGSKHTLFYCALLSVSLSLFYRAPQVLRFLHVEGKAAKEKDQNSLYRDTHVIAVVESQTCNISTVCLL